MTRLSESLTDTAAKFRADAAAELAAGNPESAGTLSKLADQMERLAINHRAEAILTGNPALDPVQIAPEAFDADTPRRFREARQSVGMTQAAAAAALGVHHMTVSKWERGMSRIPGHALLALDAIAAKRRDAEAG